jgi:uncharacterized membrane protein YkoI
MLIVVVMVVLVLPALAAAYDAPRQSQIGALEKSQISLLQAISNIESASGGRVVMVEVEPKLKPPDLRKGPMVYELLTVKDHKMKAYFVDVISGKVLGQLDDWFGLLHFLTISKSEAFADAKISLVQAIALAEKESSGKTMLAKAKVKHHVLYYQVIVFMRGNNTSELVYVNATNGHVTDKATEKDGHLEE